MKYAVIKTGGKQYKIQEKDELVIDKLEQKDGDKMNFSEIILIRDQDKVIIGDPLVKNGIVEGKIIGQVKGKKIRVSKFKAKVNYRRSIGFRGKYTKVLIEKIALSDKLGSKTKKKTTKE